jgi:hypothetical protein
MNESVRPAMSAPDPPPKPLPEAWLPTQQVDDDWKPTRQVDHGWQPTQQVDEGWQPTLQTSGPATQLLTDRNDDAAGGADLGRHVGAQLWEMFVVFEPAQALQLELDRRTIDYVAVHDLGDGAARRWLHTLATTAGWPMHRLVMRSQGYGVALATIEFVELPAAGGRPLRLYSTDVDADARQRPPLAQALLAASRLAVVIVGDLPPTAIVAALQPLDDAMAASGWRNRRLLVCPQGTVTDWAGAATALGFGTGVKVTVARASPIARETWTAIVDAWNRLRAEAPDAALPELLPPQRAASAPSGTSPAPLPMQPMPDARPARATAPAVPASPLQRYAKACLDVKGMISCCVFDPSTQRTLAFAGARPGPAALATQGAALLATLGDGARTLGLAVGQPEVAVTLAGHYLVLRPVPKHAGLLLHAVLDRHATPLVLALRHLERLDEVLAGGGTPDAG